MWQSFLAGLLTGINSNPSFKYIFCSLIVLLIGMRIYKWWVRFRNRV